ncbi:MAG: hypothetical protein HY280_01180 [Nitrospinae bacterium]|nr:hypothetical protein [Nitrospinota bacterium]
MNKRAVAKGGLFSGGAFVRGAAAVVAPPVSPVTVRRCKVFFIVSFLCVI